MKPLAEYSLTIRTSWEHRARKKLRVVIWERLRDLRAAAKEHSEETARFWDEAAGAYVGFRSPGQFGEIHLYAKLLGAGYVAHEIQHFTMDYFLETETLPLTGEANERIAFLAGDITNQFWTKFYEDFEIANA